MREICINNQNKIDFDNIDNRDCKNLTGLLLEMTSSFGPGFLHTTHLAWLFDAPGIFSDTDGGLASGFEGLDTFGGI
jgi:hypothetical protein